MEYVRSDRTENKTKINYSDRNEEIFSEYLQGKSKKELAEIYKISETRIRQLLTRQANKCKKSVYRLNVYERHINNNQ